MARNKSTEAAARHHKPDEEAIQARAAALTQFELALVVANNAFAQWVSRCGAAAGGASFSSLDLLVLSNVHWRLRNKRVADICFAMKVEDAHTVAYSLKKLGNAGLVSSQRNGKETRFSTTEAGKRLCDDYYAVRRKFLVEALGVLAGDELDLEAVAARLRVLSGLYEQAARNAATGG
jgi:predicted MarR family transcription regulator